MAAAALADIRKVRRAEEARRKEGKEKEKAAAKAARQPSAKPSAAKRKAPLTDQHTPTGKRQRVGDA